MLSEYKDIRPEKGVKSPLKNVFLSAINSEFFLRKGASNFDVFSRVFFFERIILKHIENKKRH